MGESKRSGEKWAGRGVGGRQGGEGMSGVEGGGVAGKEAMLR